MQSLFRRRVWSSRCYLNAASNFHYSYIPFRKVNKVKEEDASDLKSSTDFASFLEKVQLLEEKDVTLQQFVSIRWMLTVIFRKYFKYIVYLYLKLWYAVIWKYKEAIIITLLFYWLWSDIIIMSSVLFCLFLDWGDLNTCSWISFWIEPRGYLMKTGLTYLS